VKNNYSIPHGPTVHLSILFILFPFSPFSLLHPHNSFPFLLFYFSFSFSLLFAPSLHTRTALPISLLLFISHTHSWESNPSETQGERSPPRVRETRSSGPDNAGGAGGRDFRWATLVKQIGAIFWLSEAVSGMFQ
jgi:hypothetical protein